MQMQSNRNAFFLLEQLVLIALPWYCCALRQQSTSLPAAVKSNRTAEGASCGFVQGTRAKENSPY